MRTIIAFAALAAMLSVTAPAAEAKGCLKGAAVGAVAGHIAHHHTLLGAAVGCAVGHHLAVEKAKEQKAQAAQQQKPPAPSH